MGLIQPIARNLDESARILGLSPIELALTAMAYAVISPCLRGVPFSALLSLGLTLSLGATFLILNRTYPPFHGLFIILRFFRPKAVPVMALDQDWEKL